MEAQQGKCKKLEEERDEWRLKCSELETEKLETTAKRDQAEAALRAELRNAKETVARVKKLVE